MWRRTVNDQDGSRNKSHFAIGLNLTCSDFPNISRTSFAEGLVGATPRHIRRLTRRKDRDWTADAHHNYIMHAPHRDERSSSLLPGRHCVLHRLPSCTACRTALLKFLCLLTGKEYVIAVAFRWNLTDRRFSCNNLIRNVDNPRISRLHCGRRKLTQNNH